MSKKLDHRFWAKYFRVYDVLNMVIPYQELLDTIIEELDVKRGDFILDAGCGTGNLAVRLEKKGAKVVGIDFSEEALKICKEKIKDADIRFHDLIQPLPFPDSYFDKVVSNNVIYALPKAARLDVIKEFKRVLKKDGLVVISNVHEGFKPALIYKDHFKKSINSKGLTATFFYVVRMLIPTIRMFYYNGKAKKEHNKFKEHFSFMKRGEQPDLFDAAGFYNISKELDVYSGQGVLCRAEIKK